MLEPRNNVLRPGGLISESLVKTLISNAVRKVQLGYSLSDQDLADMIASSAATIANARNGENKLQVHTLLNLISIDPLALEGLLHHFGRRSVPIEARCDTDELVTTSSAVHKLAVAKSPDSCGGTTVSDRECLDMEAEIDAALESLSAIKQRCLAIHRGRAA